MTALPHFQNFAMLIVAFLPTLGATTDKVPINSGKDIIDVVTCDHGWIPGPTDKCYLFVEIGVN